MLMALDLSARMGWLAAAEVARLRRLLEAFGLPVRAPEHMTAERSRERMALDKKVVDGQLRLVLLQGIGEAALTTEAPLDLVRATRAARRAPAGSPGPVCA